MKILFTVAVFFTGTTIHATELTKEAEVILTSSARITIGYYALVKSGLAGAFGGEPLKDTQVCTIAAQAEMGLVQIKLANLEDKMTSFWDELSKSGISEAVIRGAVEKDLKEVCDSTNLGL
ncbi:MAG: hypothetical protein KDD22_05195 [Bdellovibrionales bacterium]|nr:hypothetical protein [Bdellovibrionales bacterium]